MPRNTFADDFSAQITPEELIDENYQPTPEEIAEYNLGMEEDQRRQDENDFDWVFDQYDKQYFNEYIDRDLD